MNQNLDEKQARFQRNDIPHRLGDIASNLARVRSFCNIAHDVKYMAWDYLVYLITRKRVEPSKICREIYQRYINGDISLPNT